MASKEIDPITLAVIKNALDSIVDEVAYTVLRTARSEIVKDVMDYSAALCNVNGEMIAQAKTIALHLGAVPEAMKEVITQYGNSLRPNGAIILNDPYQGGMHLPDIFMFLPIFFEEQLQGFSVVICHHTDVGGRVAGSNASDSTEIFPGRAQNTRAQAVRGRGDEPGNESDHQHDRAPARHRAR